MSELEAKQQSEGLEVYATEVADVIFKDIIDRFGIELGRKIITKIYCKY